MRLLDSKIHSLVLGPADPSRNIAEPLRLMGGETIDNISYDFKTFFFDVWISADGARLEALGPPLLNLENALFPLAIEVDGKHVPYRIRMVPRCPLVHLVASIPRQLSTSDCRVRISWKNGRGAEFHLAPTIQFGKNTIVATTLQKNNKTRWIRDWLQHYRNLGATAFVIYDNGSSDFAGLNSTFENDVLVLDWPFPYGPFRGEGNKFTQPGSLNHIRMRFAPWSVIANFDIDELLVLPDRIDFDHVKRRKVVHFDNYWVPFVRPQVSDYSFGDFTLREPQPRGNACKYLAYAPAVESLHTHRADLKGFNIRHLLYDLRGKRRRRVPPVPVSEGYFLHFKGITNNWKASYWDRLQAEPSEGLVEDPYLASLAKAKP